MIIAICILSFIVVVLFSTLVNVVGQVRMQEKLKEQALNDLRHIRMYYIQGIKGDRIYPFCSLIPVECLIEISHVLEHGAVKYSQDGWKTFVTPDLTHPIVWYSKKAEGHIAKYWDQGNGYEKESGCHHMAHVVANAIFVMWHDMNKNEGMK